VKSRKRLAATSSSHFASLLRSFAICSGSASDKLLVSPGSEPRSYRPLPFPHGYTSAFHRLLPTGALLRVYSERTTCVHGFCPFGAPAADLCRRAFFLDFVLRQHSKRSRPVHRANRLFCFDASRDRLGQRARQGTRIPPSQSVVLRPFQGALRLRLAPPLSLMKTTSVLPAEFIFSSCSRIRPTATSMCSTMAV